MTKSYSIGEFAKKTGTTIRTLHYYDKIGLLTPAEISASGRRYYGDDHIIQLQKIVSLKFLGYSLEEINEFIHLKDWDLKKSLSFQRQEMVEKKEQIERVIRALDHALEIFEDHKMIDSSIFISLINNIRMEKEHKEWLKEYLQEEVIEQMYNISEEKQRELNKEAAVVFGLLKQAFGQDPASQHVQTIIEQFFTLSQEIYGDILSLTQEIMDTGIEVEDDPKLFPSPFTKEEEEWVSQVMEIYMSKRGVSFNENKG
ncbi:MerR family transcriptional regulator [Niallia sp. Krafla_26]|uniref:MerR family transcriptional regulator n=1 Tax=Niallia sp. Krafla_26 TaxID=3064703 RepID=UPI003D178A3C